MRDYQRFKPLPIVGASRVDLELADGRTLVDAISSWWCKSLGHGHPRLRAALVAQAESFEHVITANCTHEPLVRCCEGLLERAHEGLPERRWGKVFLGDSGSTAMEIALKMALQAQVQMGRPGRTAFAGLEGGYHGETVATLSVGDCDLYSAPYKPLMFPSLLLGPLPLRTGPDDPAWMDASAEWPAIEAALDAQAATLAAVVFEPVLQGAGGMRVVSPDLLVRLRRWADANDVFLIADEIASGMGRCGHWLASHLAGPDGQADLVAVSKGLTGGMLPLSAVLVPDAIYDCFDSEYSEGKAFLHSNTWTGNALAVAVANAVFETISEESVFENVAAVGPQLRAGLTRLAESRPYLGNLRGVGMMAAIDIQGRDASQRTGYAVYQAATRRGALLRPLGDTMYLFPPLISTPADVERMLSIMADSLDEVLGG
jgi:adenosylmethionine-8-amino-7-oxononanoate aminotransferase